MFRTRGESKMSFSQTSKSYLVLLRSRFDGWSLAALAFLLLGILLRVLYAFPVHKYAPDADSLLSALRAFDILGGKLRIFYSYVRIGALESYLHVFAFLLLGPSRVAISLAPLACGALSLLAFFFLVRELFGRRLACCALLVFALASPSYLAWTYMPNGYPETMLFCVSTLYFAARIARTGFRPWSTVALGLCAGLGFWNSIQTLVCTIPAVLWLFFQRRREILAKPGFLAVLAASFAFGALPWILYNVRYSFPSLRQNFAARPAHGLQAIVSNFKYLVSYDLLELTVGLDPLGKGGPRNQFEALFQSPAAIVYASGLLILLVALHTSSREPSDRQRMYPLPSLLLLWMVVLTVVLLYCLSEAGETRGLTVRYVLPFYAVLAAGVGLLTYEAWKFWRPLAAVLVLTVVFFNVSGYYLPWSRERIYLRELMRSDTELVEYLKNQRIKWVAGNYWVVYPLNFVSRERVLGLPFQADHDHYRYSERLPPRPVPWAIAARNGRWLASWVERARLNGEIVRLAHVLPAYYVFLPDRGEVDSRSPQRTLWLLRDTVSWGH